VSDQTAYAEEGAASGALSGAAYGPWGALAGGVLGGLGGYFGTSKPKVDDYSQMLQNISRAQWAQEAAHMYPLQNQLIHWAEDPNYGKKEADVAATDVSKAFATQQVSQNQQLGYQGLAPTAAQSAAMEKTKALDEASVTAAAENQATQQAKASQQAVLGAA
jgi:hypothetical protein